jgi:carbamoyl-phosphate synthase large subunit
VHNTRVKKVYEGQPNIVDALKNSEIDLIFNTTQGSQSLKDSRAIRAAALSNKICYYTTAAASNAAAKAIKDTQNSKVEVNALQNY